MCRKSLSKEHFRPHGRALRVAPCPRGAAAPAVRQSRSRGPGLVLVRGSSSAVWKGTPEALPSGWKRFRVACQLFLGNRKSRAENRHPGHTIFLHTTRKSQQFRLEPVLRRQPAKSKEDAERLRDLGQAFPLSWMGVTPSRAEFKLVQNLISGFGAGFRSKLVPQVFHELKALKLAKMLNGLQGGFHAEKFSTPHVNSRACGQTRMKVKIENSLELGCQRSTD